MNEGNKTNETDAKQVAAKGCLTLIALASISIGSVAVLSYAASWLFGI
jgi:hypothetical protein